MNATPKIRLLAAVATVLWTMTSPLFAASHQKLEPFKLETASNRLCFYETPTYMTIKSRSAGGQLIYDAEHNVAFGQTKQTQLSRRLK